MLRLYSIIFLVANVKTLIRAEFFTAVDDMQLLIQTHQEVTSWLNKYVEIENKRLDVIQRLLEQYKVEDRRATEEGIRYLENPINVYKLTKILTKDLEFIENKVKTKYNTVNILPAPVLSLVTVHAGFDVHCGTQILSTFFQLQYSGLGYRIKKPLQYPTSEDLQGAAKAVARLELIYKLNTSDLANGVIAGTFSHYNKPYVEKVTPMKSSDCFELAQALYSKNYYGNGKPWMEDALRKYREEKEWHYYTEDEIKENINYAEFKVAEQKIIDEQNKKLPLKQTENNCTTTSGEVHLTDQFCNERRDQENKFVPVLLNSATRYSALCRGEYDISGRVAKKLFCCYLRSHPFLLLAPVKMEQLYMRPDIFLFYDVISESEIDYVKKLAKKKRLQRTTIHDESGKPVTSPDRISKSAWFPDSTCDVIRRLSRRVGDVTGLAEETADHLAVVNYGVGGYYAPHYDFFRKSLVTSRGNRIATVLLYLSNVPQGGATIFMEPGLTVFPTRGAALFWYNLHPSGEGDLATYHAACPVLSGSKWVATKWLFDLGQELRKPCAQPQPEDDKKTLYKTPTPKLKILTVE